MTRQGNKGGLLDSQIPKTHVGAGHETKEVRPNPTDSQDWMAALGMSASATGGNTSGSLLSQEPQVKTKSRKNNFPRMLR